ncbi:TonB-dependent receptor [Granulicella sp. S190]|uniref:TonB-dependent receptor n=1 Tax=Granulicella sp. S190 TaxID=1747226 RepID=UPI00131A70C0|nr:TonB-dependent receptor [Granulicella sp. S190]
MKLMMRATVGMAFAVCLLASSPIAHAQAVYGSIFGTVVDTTGAAVPGATVTITDSAKGTTVTATSNGSGEFTVEHLIPDLYDVAVAAQGFKGFQQKGIQLFADTSTKVVASMTVGGSDQTVEVDADQVPQLKTDRADVSTIFGAKDIGDLPVGGRNFTNLQLLLPGAQLLGWSHAPDENPQGSAQIQVDGQAFGGVAFMLDGTDNQDPILGIIVVNPNLDSLSETKITTQNFDAEFGKAVSSVVTAQTKSGSNKFHGSAFDYRTSTANLAQDPYTQFPAEGTTAGSAIAPGLKNLFGGSIGGPILKDRVFFFGDYQGARQRVGTTSSTIVPTSLVTSSCLSGNGCNFSEFINPGLGLNYPVYHVVNGATVQYPGNVVPQADLSAPALNYIKAIAQYAPNKIGASGLLDTYVQGGTGIFNSDQWDVRLDGQVTQKAHAFVRFSRFTDTLTGTLLLGAAGGPGFGLGGYGGNSAGANDSVASGMDIAINSTLVTDFRLGYYRYNINDQKFDAGTSAATSLGFGGLNTADPITSGLPGFQINTFTGSTQTEWGAGLNINRCNCPLIEKEDQYQIVNNWTKTIRNHAVKFGVDLRYARNLRVPSDVDRTGLFNFNGNATAPSDGSTPGLGIASFVKGDVNTFNRYVSTSTNAKEFQKRTFYYAQDTWRATPKLTLNLGVRYELYFPEAVNGVGNGALLDLTSGYLHVAGVGSVPTNMGWAAGKNTWNPRIGIAYQATDKTVVRAGYGRSFDLGVFGSIFGHVVTQNLPVLANQAITASGSNAASYAKPFDLATGPVPNQTVTVPSNGLLPNPGSLVSTKARPNPLKLPTLDAWNMSVQQSLSPTLSVTMAYVGNKGTNTLSAGDGNNTNPNEPGIFLPAAYSVTGFPLHYDPAGGNCWPAGANCTAAGVNGNVLIPASGAVSTQKFLERYYGGALPACQDPNYSQPTGEGLAPGACGWNQPIGYYGDNQNTHFNALQVTVAKQISHGLSFTGNYAWQRGFNYNNSYATWLKQAAYGRDDSIREQQFVIYGLYELPVGRNKLLLPNSSRLVDEIIGGWQLSPVLNISSGLPYSLSMSNCASSVGGAGIGDNSGHPTAAPCYPNGNPGSFHPQQGAFNPVTHSRPYFSALPALCPSTGSSSSGFTCPGLDQIGNTGRNSNFGPHFFNTDLAIQKTFPIKESISALFRMDAFNVFNYISSGTPNGNSNNLAIDSNAAITNGIGGNGIGPVGASSPRQLSFTARITF